MNHSCVFFPSLKCMHIKLESFKEYLNVVLITLLYIDIYISKKLKWSWQVLKEKRRIILRFRSIEISPVDGSL